MTFEEFQASRREVDDVTAAVELYHTEVQTPGYVYAGDVVIEKLGDSQIYLLIANSERIEDAANLHLLERDLYDYASRDGKL